MLVVLLVRIGKQIFLVIFHFTYRRVSIFDVTIAQMDLFRSTY